MAHSGVEVTIVIPNYNGRRWLGPCLESISAQIDSGAEIVVVDNASTDDSVAWVRRHWPSVRVVEQRSNRGYGAACNAGGAVAHGRTVIFVNNDVIVRPGWSAALVRCLDAEPDCVIAGGVTLFMHDPTRVNTAGIRVTRSLAGVDETDQPADGRDVAAVSGVSFAVNREWFHAVGGFDEGFFMYYEDLELCLRAWSQGRRVRLVPDSVSLHAAGATSGDRDGGFRHRHTTRNRLLCAFKLLELRELSVAWALSLLTDAAAVLWHLAGGHPRLAGRVGAAKIAGTAAALAALPRWFAARRTIQATRERSTRELRRLGLIEPLGRSSRGFVSVRRRSGDLRRPAR